MFNKTIIQYGTVTPTTSGTKVNISVTYPHAFPTVGVPMITRDNKANGTDTCLFVGIFQGKWNTTGWTTTGVGNNYTNTIFWYAIGY